MTVLGGLEEACVSIHADSGEILDCNEAAANLLGVSAATLVSAAWRNVIPCAAESASVLEHALQAGRRVMLPPLILLLEHFLLKSFSQDSLPN